MKKLQPITILVLIFWNSGCDIRTSYFSDDSLHNKIQSKLTNYNTGYKNNRTPFVYFKIEELTDFAWDAVYCFHSDSGFPTNIDIEQAICGKFYGTEMIQGETRLVFTRGKEAVRYADFTQSEYFNLSSEAPCKNMYTDGFIKYSRTNFNLICFKCATDDAIQLTSIKNENISNKSFKPCEK